ncbi:hypothetical protein [Thiohalomonas denitrificans]|uniref:Uncharacterized protein n=1 Tax=Thiohalomonas denitrificans TaxID=415747 RepID=A0A1G5QEH0_9GAMM|nr:hypothetical protein [Thiohalomonas denitrificans]SCZ60204.1 hypothetical protein SAMN03097708_02006 [Thiohalomonas denitrificans]
MHRKLIGIAVSTLFVAGCAGPDPLKDDFGESVRHMIRVQTDNPAYQNGSGLDGERAERTLRDYRGAETGTVGGSTAISNGM